MRWLEIKRTSGEPTPSGNTATGGGCTRRGYKTFLRLLREVIEVTEYGNDIFEDKIELDVSAIVWRRPRGR
jgi:hypothetical protein